MQTKLPSKEKAKRKKHLKSILSRELPRQLLIPKEPVVKTGQKVKKGDLLVDGPASQNGELALGQNLVNCLHFFRRFRLRRRNCNFG